VTTANNKTTIDMVVVVSRRSRLPAISSLAAQLQVVQRRIYIDWCNICLS
jgi:hypothetical protein